MVLQMGIDASVRWDLYRREWDITIAGTPPRQFSGSREQAIDWLNEESIKRTGLAPDMLRRPA
jgi:hypothetical protein